MKINFIFLVLVNTFCWLKLFSQPPTKEWDARFGTSKSDDFRYVRQTLDGGYILGGHTLAGIDGDKSGLNKGSSDYWIIKTNAAGVKQWDAGFGGTVSENLWSIKPTSDGGYILGGSSSSGIGGDKTQINKGMLDYWIVKIDSNGIKQWDAGFGGTANDNLYDVHQTKDGGYLIGGSSYSSAGFDKSQPSQGKSDYWIVKVNENGTKQWDVSFGGSDYEDFFSIVEPNDGGYLFGGSSSSGVSGDRSQPSQGGQDYWIVKTDTNGIKHWDARFGGSEEDVLISIKSNSNGGYILGGYSDSPLSGDKTQANHGGDDYWLVKIDQDGTKIWDARFGGTGEEVLWSIDQTIDDGYIAGGYSNSGIGGDKSQTSQGINDYWIIKVDKDGQKLWDARFGGSLNDYFYSGQYTIDGGYILGGWSLSGITGDKSQASLGSWDYWIVKTSAPPCNIPQNTSTDSITSNQASLMWGSVNGAIKYKVKYKIANTSEWTKVTTIDNHKNLSGLLASTKYAWKVKAICYVQPIHSSEWSEKLIFYTDPYKIGNEESNMLNDQPFKVEVYPNPVKDELTIKLSAEWTDATIFIYDLRGQLITVQRVVEYPQIKIKATDLANGLYNIQIIDNKHGFSKAINFVKQE